MLWDELLKKPNINYNNFSDIGMHLFTKKEWQEKIINVRMYKYIDGNNKYTHDFKEGEESKYLM